ncbi:polysaccharide deacetylase [Trinickia symbiotica]|uniref:Polysaccharide deacetylase n=1 Tax=Trinickia symbiotica TaxID=863227 RepID=A0A2T3XUP3_9BURK|nr:polysaccharide deacetylase family protein [Trinickia symbiotica]PTB20221.1 polysaccharide deacetylase [Trinickia symbiotica]
MASGGAAFKEFVAMLFVLTGVARAARALLWRDRVAILLYHDPDPATLDAHLGYLREMCDFVPLEEARTPGQGRPRAVITLDDGHIGNADLLPVFIKHRVRPTIFLCSGVVGRARTHWWLHPGAKEAGIERLKHMTNTERLAELEAYGYRQDGDDRATGLTAEQIEAMRPYVDFQAHTQFHPVLTRCNDAECENEIVACKREIEQLVGNACLHFAYPNGNYGKREVELVKAAGYKSARTCDVGWNDGSTDPFRLRTIIIDDHASVRWFAAQLTGIPLSFRYLRHGGWGGRFPQF